MTAPSAEGIEPDITSLVGRSTGSQVIVVERGPVTKFADAVLDAHPIYHRGDAARAAGFADIPAPPTFAMALAHWGTFEEIQTDPESTDTSSPSLLELLAPFLPPGGLVLHGEQEFAYHRPVVVGDVLVGEGRVIDAYRKESKGRTMTFVVVETAWTDRSTGEPVVTGRSNVIYLT